MQQDCVQATNNSESKLRCEVHPENELQILHFGEKQQSKSRMMCVQCIIKSYNKGENLKQFVHIHKFLIDPKKTLFKILNINKEQSQQNISKMFDNIDKLFVELEEKIKNQLFRIKENIQQMRIQIQYFVEELSNELKLNDVVKQIQLLNQMDSCQGTSELINLESQLNYIGENLNKSYLNLSQKVKGNQSRTAQKILDNQQIIKNDIESTQKKFIDNLAKLNLFEATEKKIIDNLAKLDLPWGLEDIQDFPQIHKQISEGKIITYELLYQGTRDGLSGQAYWAKCNLECNLLTIMTSKNGNKFGGYSPCQINQQLQSYVQDPTMKSFIFQYNKKEIYKLKDKEYAVYCHPSYGPTYGGYDIYVNQDFQVGYSNGLGHSYDISGSHIVDKASYIFGALKPQLEECKVYKVIFK